MTGLTNEQVQQRIEEGKINVNENPNTRSYKQIVRENVLTFFNFLNLALMIMVLLVGSYKNSMFMGIIVINTVIGIIQEVRAKKTLDKLAILTESKAVVLREGKKWSISTEKLVLDDILFLKTGDQVPADARVLEGSIEVNESLLTGESDNLQKNEGDELFSGSFVTSGEACCQVIHVGKDNYASQITSEAKEFKRHNSELRNSLNAILKTISVIIVPMGMLLFYKQYYIAGNGIRDAVVNMVAAVLGMIPETMCVEQVQPYVEGMEIKAPEAENENISESTINGTANQAQKVPEMAAAEAQSEVSVVAAQLQIGVVMGTTEQLSAQDSQGNVNTDLAISGAQPELTMGEIERVMANMMSVLKDKNATADALHKRFSRRTDMPVDHCIPFSSDRKYSGVAFKTEGTYLMGAAQFLFPDGNENLIKQCAAYGKEGLRVLVLAHSPNLNRENELPEGLKPVALFMLTDIIRDNAPETLAFFKDQGVDLKVISGDDPVTVSAIAKKAGLENADKYIDATTITTPEDMERAVAECSVFGRVTPQQKKEMVLALQKQKHTVAMTGDGVNDVLALKEADCSVVMAEGSDAAKNIANVVLMDSNFAAMPEIVNQGRRVVNNIRTAASMFLIKTIFSVLLCLITIFWGDSYPFEPIQMSLISACAVGIPTFLLAQENNFNKIESGFLRYVFMNAFPAAVTITGCVFTIMLVCQNVYHSNVMLSTACFLVTGWNYMAALKTVYAPLSRYRKIIIYGMQFIFFFAAVCVQNLLALGSLEFGMIILVFILMTFSPVVIEVITEWCRSLYNKAHEKEKKGIISLFLEKVQK